MANTVYLSPLSVMWDTTLTASGILNNNGNVTIYLAGTTTPANTYTANGGLILNPNPIQVMSTGRLPNQIWQLQGQALKGVLTDINGITLDTQNDVLGIDDPSFASTQANNAFNTANAAYTQANTATTIANAANTTSKNAANTANSAANTVAVYANGTLTLANANLNFNNTATVNVSAVANGLTQTNVSFSVNTTSSILGNTSSVANGYVRLASNAAIQWGNVAFANPFGAAAVVTFPTAFTTSVWGVQVSMTGSGSNQANRPLVFNPSRTQFTIEFDNFNQGQSNPATTVFWWAIGD